MGLRIAWSVRAGRPAYSVSRGRRAPLARRRGASSETTSLWLFLCELLAVECGFGDKFVTFCYLSAARACASDSAVFELKNRATRFSTAVEPLVRRVTRVVRAARASTVLSPKASVNEGVSHRGGHVSASTELRVSITVAITASVKSQTPRGFYQPRGHPSLRRCSERSIAALALTCLGDGVACRPSVFLALVHIISARGAEASFSPPQTPRTESRSAEIESVERAVAPNSFDSLHSKRPQRSLGLS